jgi:hypothetical protein
MKNNFIEWLQGSADNKPGGASSKKLSAFWTLVVLVTVPVLTWTLWAYKHNDWSLLISVLTILSLSIATYLGINSNEKIKGKANSTEKENKDENI